LKNFHSSQNEKEGAANTLKFDTPSCGKFLALSEAQMMLVEVFKYCLRLQTILAGKKKLWSCHGQGFQKFFN